jgi:hypothetical protein
LTYLGTRRDPSAFEYVPTSSAPAVLSCSRQQYQSTSVSALIEQGTYRNSEDDNSNDNSKYIGIDDLIDPQLKALSTMQLGIQRLRESPDIYLPGTLPPRLYQTNPFSMQRNDKDLGSNVYELAADAIPATAEEIRQMEDDEADEEALFQAIETVLATTRAG